MLALINNSPWIPTNHCISSNSLRYVKINHTDDSAKKGTMTSTIRSQVAFHPPTDPARLRFLARNSSLTSIHLVVAGHEVASLNI